ncbi:hypothetical protein JVU11DRAFT_167 [Chiua virens]|nr:hypothetical protein JVU11DRAFT_167 [Chiua virens]
MGHSYSDPVGVISQRAINHRNPESVKRNLCPKSVQRWDNIALDVLQKLYPRAQSQNIIPHSNGAEPCEEEYGRRTSEMLENGKNGYDSGKACNLKGDLCVIHPRVDGRFKDVARSTSDSSDFVPSLPAVHPPRQCLTLPMRTLNGLKMFQLLPNSTETVLETDSLVTVKFAWFMTVLESMRLNVHGSDSCVAFGELLMMNDGSA